MVFKLAEPKIKLIEKTAMEFAAIFYDEQRSIGMKSKYKTARAYSKANFEKFIPTAITILTDMLGKPGYPELLKQEIYEALTERASDKKLNFLDQKPVTNINDNLINGYSLPKEFYKPNPIKGKA